MTSGSLILVIAVLILPLTICSPSIYTIGGNSCLHEDITYKPQPRHLNSIHSPTLKKKKKVTFDDNVVVRRMQQRRQADNRDTTKLGQIRNVYTQPRAMNVRSSKDERTAAGTAGSSTLPKMKIERPKSVMQESRRPPMTVPPVSAARSNE